MTKAQLIAALADVPDNAEVCCAGADDLVLVYHAGENRLTFDDDYAPFDEADGCKFLWGRTGDGLAEPMIETKAREALRAYGVNPDGMTREQVYERFKADGGASPGAILNCLLCDKPFVPDGAAT
jgi:hypothetical protein